MIATNAPGQKQSGTAIAQDIIKPRRGYRAVTERMTVLNERVPAPADVMHLSHITTGSGAINIVKPRFGIYPDRQYLDIVDKHILCVRHELEQKPVPIGTDEPTLNDQFRQFVAPESRGGN